jgi:hypothetical protein
MGIYYQGDRFCWWMMGDYARYVCHLIAIQAPDRGQVFPQRSTMKVEPNMLKIKPYQKRKNNSANCNPTISQGYPRQVLKIRSNLNINTGSPSSCESANSLHILNTAQIKPGFQYKANKVSGLKVFPVGKCYLLKKLTCER